MPRGCAHLAWYGRRIPQSKQHLLLTQARLLRIDALHAGWAACLPVVENIMGGWEWGQTHNIWLASLRIPLSTHTERFRSTQLTALNGCLRPASTGRVPWMGPCACKQLKIEPLVTHKPGSLYKRCGDALPQDPYMQPSQILQGAGKTGQTVTHKHTTSVEGTTCS